nr:cyclase family protein [Allomuricauda sp.]
MIANLKHKTGEYQVDLAKPLDISIAMQGGGDNINAWYLDSPKIAPHKEGDFVGKVSLGASTNFNDIWFNPHSHVTHTECLGHITEDKYSINQELKKFFFLTEVITVAPEKQGTDSVISAKQLRYALGNKKPEAVVIRTIPNMASKKQRKYSNTNPPYMLKEAMDFLVSNEVLHILVDLPSVDKEKDGGALQSHRAFWNMDGIPRRNATITEFVFVENKIKDGRYLLNLQVAPFENDASPSRPVLFKILEE